MCTAVGRFGEWVKKSGMVSGLYFIRRVPDQGQKRRNRFGWNALMFISMIAGSIAS